MNKRNVPEDIGFGTKISGKEQRMINRDGSFNVSRKGQSFWDTFNVYHSLITMRWSKFLLYVLLFYIAINLLFGSIYYYIGMEHLAGALGASPAEKFFDAFFFSAQTVTTLGYGRISPMGFWASFAAAIESIVGLMGFALITGLIYGRFSRPNAKIIQSTNALIAPYKDMNALMFRIINGKVNQLIEVEIQVVAALHVDENGQTARRFLPLELERNKISLFPTNWTVVHPIDENSPLKNMDAQELKKRDAEFSILLKGFDDSFSQTVYWRSSFKHNEIVWGAKFVNILTNEEDGSLTIDMSRFNNFDKVPLNKTDNITSKETLELH
jgi:inward rectifier potassium channel